VKDNRTRRNNGNLPVSVRERRVNAACCAVAKKPSVVLETPHPKRSGTLRGRHASEALTKSEYYATEKRMSRILGSKRA
jgi:hypothetical protein